MERPDRQRGAAVLQRPLLLWSLPFVFLSFMLPIYSKRLGANALEIGGLFSVFTGTTLVLRPAVGWAVDRFGRRRFLIFALCIYALAMAAFAAADSIAGLYVARLLQGVGSSFLWIAVNTIVADLTVPEERGRALGSIDQATARGGIIGVFVGFLLISSLPDAFNWEGTFALYTLTTAASAWLAWMTLPETLPPSDPGEEPKLRRVLSRPLLFLMAVVFVTGASEAMLGPIYLIFLQDRFTTDISVLAWAFLPAGLVSAFLAARLGGLSDRRGRIPMMALGLVSSGLLSLLLPHAPSLVVLAAFYTASAVVWAISEPAEAALVADLTGRRSRGRSYGVYDFASNLGFTIGPLVGGLVYDRLGKAVPFYINAVVLLVGAVFVAIILRRVLAEASGPLPADAA
jgi:DHA1 family multidrug resistance protein-like MFS transporter